MVLAVRVEDADELTLKRNIRLSALRAANARILGTSWPPDIAPGPVVLTRLQPKLPVLISVR
jgi:hypothetical protein